MAYFVKNTQSSDDLFKHHFTGTDLNSLASVIDSVMIKEGYKLISGQKGNAEYEKGSRVMRLLFGAFVKYYKFTVRLNQLDDKNIELLVVKASSGMSGGLIGMGQIKKELYRLSQVFSNI